MSKRVKYFIIVSVIFLFLACIYHYPIFGDILHASFYGQHDDVQFFFMVVGWFYHAMHINPASLFQLPIFFPYENALTFSEPLIGESIQGWPFFLLSGSIPFVFNIVTLLSAWLAGLAMFLLVKELTHNSLAAFLSGVIMLSPPQHFSELAHIQSLQIQWLPLFFYSLLRLYKSEKWRWCFGLILSATFLCYSNLYYTVFLFMCSLTFFPLFFFSSLKKQTFRQLMMLIISGIVIAILCYPLVAAYTSASQNIDFDKGLTEISHMSADLLDYCASSSWLYFSVSGRFMQTEGHFPGFTVLFLWLFSLLYLLKNWSKLEYIERAFFLAVAGAGFGAFMYSLGPVVKCGGKALLSTPYSLFYRYVPGVDAVRAISRFGIFFHFFVVTGASLSMKVLFERGKKYRKIFFSVLLSLILLETFPPIHKAPVQKPPEPNHELMSFLRKQPKDQGVLHIPVFSFLPDNSLYEWWATFNWQPIVIAHSSNYPRDIQEVAELLEYFPSHRGLEKVKSAFPVRYIVIHSQLINKNIFERIMRLLPQFPEIHFVRQYGDDYVYVLARTGKGIALKRTLIASRFDHGPLAVGLECESPLPHTNYILELTLDSKELKKYTFTAKTGFKKQFSLSKADLTARCGLKKTYNLDFYLSTEYHGPLQNKPLESFSYEDFKSIPLHISLISQPFHLKRPSESSIEVNGILHSTNETGFLCSRIDPVSGKIVCIKKFNTHAESTASSELLEFMTQTPSNQMIAGVVCDDAAAQLEDSVDEYFHTMGINYEPSLHYRWAFTFIIWGHHSPTPHAIYHAERKNISQDFGTDTQNLECTISSFEQKQ